ncbi:MAG: hypothetical protein IPP49_09870 [Saprospiraceae bacterium]|nr:hypothetical protein [Saprospiraceae bacterium]
MSQSQRDAVMAKFRNKTTSILVATDVAARGIDGFANARCSLFSPENPEYYTHRSGRTARAGKRRISGYSLPQDIGRIRFSSARSVLISNTSKCPSNPRCTIKNWRNGLKK